MRCHSYDKSLVFFDENGDFWRISGNALGMDATREEKHDVIDIRSFADNFVILSIDPLA